MRRVLCIGAFVFALVVSLAQNRREFFSRPVPAPSGTTLNDGLVGYWKLEETTTPSVDYTSNVVDLVWVATPVSATGKVNNCLDFERDDGDRLEANADSGAIDFWGDTTFTIVAWGQIESETGGVRQTMVGKYDGAGSAQYYLQYSGTSDRILFGISTDGTAETEVEANDFGAVTTATWYMVAAGRRASDDTIWIAVRSAGNSTGTRTSAAAGTTVFNSSSEFVIGGPGGIGVWDGLLDEIAVYNRELSDGELTELWNSGNGKTPPF